MKYPFVCADTETTGLDPALNEIIEVAAIEFDIEGNIGESIVKRCSPIAGYIPKQASDVHGIMYDMIKDEPSYLKGGIREEVAKFIGHRTLVGHNMENFDVKFLKVKPRRIEDTLKMCRKESRGKNNLKAACKRHGIKWDDNKAHGAKYDAEKTIELFVKLKDKDRKKVESKEETPLFAQANSIDAITSEDKEIVKITTSEDLKLIGVVPTDNDKELIATQAYSFSRINLFHQCPFKWYMQYIKKIKQPQLDYLTTGSVCHKIAEWSGKWCNRELFANKFAAYSQTRELSIGEDMLNELAKLFNKEVKSVTVRDFGLFLFDNPREIKNFFDGTKGLADLTYQIDQGIEYGSYEVPSIPDHDTYSSIINEALNLFKCTDPSIINDVKGIMYRFYSKNDFSLTPGDVAVTEMKIALDKDWKRVKDFYSDKVFFRGIIDIIDYYGEYIIITDYKTSRTMLTEKQLKEDMQTLVYLMLINKLLGDNKYNKVKIRINYIRYSKIVEYEVPNVRMAIERAEKWVNSSIQEIEKEMLKIDGTAFQPRRNEYCGYCHIGEDGKCPLFNKQFINNIDDPYSFSVNDIDDCRDAWKRIEANQSENKRLVKLCKKFVKDCTDKITIDENAILDFYVSEGRNYDASKAATLMLKKKIDIRELMQFFSITEKAMKELLEYKKIELTDEELNIISKVKRKAEFKALTEKESEGKYLNA